MTRKYWNKQLCAEEALKYKTKTDFNSKFAEEYDAVA